MTRKKNIENIKEAILQNSNVFTSMGVTNGLAGVSLFCYYAHLFEDSNPEQLDLSLNFLQQAINGLNDNYSGPNVVNDILEIAELLYFFEERGVMTLEDINNYLEYYEPILLEFLEVYVKENSISPSTGAIKFANYFLNKPQTYVELETTFMRLLVKIEFLSKTCRRSGGIYWISEIERNGEYLVELGFRHGVTGIIDFLLKLYQHGFESERVKILILKGLKFIQYYNYQEGLAYFPFSTKETKKERSFSYGTAYGDLGIGYVFSRAGELLKDKSYQRIGREIIHNSGKYRDENRKLIRDANLLYGCLGITSFFSLFEGSRLELDLNRTIEYWYGKIDEYRVEDSEWAGFDTRYNKFDVNAQASFSHGIIGIGIALMSKEKKMNKDYMRFLNYYPIN